MSEIEKLNMIAEWQKQYKQLIEDLDNSKKRIADLEEKLANADYQLEGRDNEIRELKADNDARKFAMAMSEKVEKHLREKNIKAKDFILKLTTYLEGHTNYDFEYELIKEVKQFLKESEVEK